MEILKQIFEKNRAWAKGVTDADPEFFHRLSNQQSPEYLWIGCSDSRVPANQIMDLPPGEVFVHRNVANQVISADINCLSVIQFSVETLKVKHIIVTGHYGCGGVQAALENQASGYLYDWLEPLRGIASQHRKELTQLTDKERVNRLCELNVIAQVAHVCQTYHVQRA